MDVDGFVVDGQSWSEELAIELAMVAGIEALTEKHWAVIRTLRDNYVPGEPDWLPQVRGVCRSLGMPNNCVTEMFGDPLVAWRIAGLPKPAADLQGYVPSTSLG
jgi:tRNA 2-thiouridine synthesizing protein E